MTMPTFDQLWKAVLLVATDQCFFSQHYPDEYKEDPVLCIICNDTFAFASADCERVLWEEVEAVYNCYKKDPKFGLVRWVCKKRNEKPIYALPPEID